jgi:hypothetical protein
VFGGHGYVSEWGIEQILRDARITMIYEGTNEIQAIDLLVRKVLADGARGMNALLDTLQADVAEGTPARHTLDALQAATAELVATCAQQPEHAYWVAQDYLNAVARALLGWAWSRIAQTPGAHVPRWQAPAQALTLWVLPEATGALAQLRRAPTLA